MMQQLNDVATFQARFGHGYDGPPRVPSRDEIMFRLRFLAEELRELGEALGAVVDTTIGWVGPTKPPEVALADALDALVDQDYVLKGTVLQLGLGDVYPEAWRRVHTANLLKVPGVKSTRGYGKDVIKPPGWTAPDLADLVTLE